MVRSYIPDRGDIVWLDMNPQAGHEQAGRRPALVLSPKSYNKLAGLFVVCPITNQSKGYPFEVMLPEDLDVKGAVLSDQVKSLDWKARNADFKCRVDDATLAHVLAKVKALLQL